MSRLMLAVLALALSAGAAAAQDRAGRGFALLDADGDGQISMVELNVGKAAMFDRIDANGDGMVDADEIAAARRAVQLVAAAAESRLDRTMARLDKDGDGKVSKAEYLADAPLFALADANGDGIVSQDEIARIRGILGR